MYLENLNFYNNILLNDNSIIKLTVNIIDNEVTVTPNMYDTYNNIIRSVSKCMEWLKVLLVWQKESCICVPFKENEKESDLYENTLYKKIINNLEIREIIEKIGKNSYNLMIKINKYLKR